MEQSFRREGGGIPPHEIPSWATHWRMWYSPDGYRDAIEFTDSPESVVTPPSVGQPGAAMVSKWYELDKAEDYVQG